MYDESQMMMMNPFFQEFVPMRLIPVKKRMIRSYKTKDGKDVEVRSVYFSNIRTNIGIKEVEHISLT